MALALFIPCLGMGRRRRLQSPDHWAMWRRREILQACTGPPSGSLSGLIVLIERGTCTFLLKVQNAEAAGAAGVIFTNNPGDDSLIVPSGLSGTTIPASFIGYDDGQTIRTFLAANQKPAVSIAPNLIAFRCLDLQRDDFLQLPRSRAGQRWTQAGCWRGGRKSVPCGSELRSQWRALHSQRFSGIPGHQLLDTADCRYRRPCEAIALQLACCFPQ